MPFLPDGLGSFRTSRRKADALFPLHLRRLLRAALAEEPLHRTGVNERTSLETETPHGLVRGRAGSIARSPVALRRGLQALHSPLPHGGAFHRAGARRPC